MAERFFLALDYKTDDEAIKNGMGALSFLNDEFGEDFVADRMGVKINENLLTHTINPRHRHYREHHGCAVFGDLKVSHGAGNGEEIIDRVVGTGPEQGNLPLQFVTVSAGLGPTILRKYVDACGKRGINVVAFTAHTKIPPEEVEAMYGTDLNTAIYRLSKGAYEAGCDSVVMEGERLKDSRIKDLAIKKLVTGIRIDTEDKGEQSRVTALDSLGDVNPNYVVVSSKYVGDTKKLGKYIHKVLDSLKARGASL